MEAKSMSLQHFDLYRRKCLRNIGIFSIFVNILMLVLPIYSLQVFSRVLSSRSEETLILLTTIAVFLLIFQSVLEFIRRRMLSFIANAFDSYLLKTIVANSFLLEATTLRSGQSLMNQMNEARSGYSSHFILVLFDLPWTPFFVFVVYLIEPLLGVYALSCVVILAFLGALNTFLVSKKQKTLLDNTAKHRRGLQALLITAREVAFNGWSEKTSVDWGENAEQLNLEQDRYSLLQTSFQSMTKVVRQVMQVGVLALGAWLVISDQAIPGVLLAGSILLGRVLAPIEQGINQWESWSHSTNSISVIRELFVKSSALGQGAMDVSKGASLTFEAFSMRDCFSRVLLQNIQFELKQGQCLLIKGAMGAGKSLLLENIVNVHKQVAGKVKINNVVVAEMSVDQRAEVFGYVPPSPKIVEGTVIYNITGAEPSDNVRIKCIDICRRLGLDSLINGLPQSYDTEIGMSGVALSSGTIKLIGIARAFYRNPPIYLLDEPELHLASTDIERLKTIFSELHDSGKSLLLVSNEVKLEQLADWMILLEKGKIVKAARLKGENQNVSPIRGN